MATSAETPTAEASARPRLDSLDLLRGLVMVLMALDHARDYFSPSYANGSWVPPELIPDVGAGLFLTRWVTHFCAPVFVFLAGTSAFLYQSRGRSTGAVSRFLIVRGAWLILLEFTLVEFAWLFSWSYLGPNGFLVAQVIWALGASMIVLAGLIWLPQRLIAALGLALIFGHNLADTSAWELALGDTLPAEWTVGQKLWALLHVQSFFPIVAPTADQAGYFIAVMYPLVPWIGVMAVGYVFGRVMLQPADDRRRTLLGLGLGATALFVALRLVNGYGDPRPWSDHGGAVPTAIAFLNCQKYPPSLLFLLMTLGPSIVLLALFEHARSRLARMLVTIGRVPLFFYLAHLYLIHGAAVLWAVARFGREAAGWGPIQPAPPEYSMGLWLSYVAWLAAVALLYPACRWFAGVKQRSRNPLLSYL